MFFWNKKKIKKMIILGNEINSYFSIDPWVHEGEYPTIHDQINHDCDENTLHCPENLNVKQGLLFPSTECEEGYTTIISRSEKPFTNLTAWIKTFSFVIDEPYTHRTSICLTQKKLPEICNTYNKNRKRRYEQVFKIYQDQRDFDEYSENEEAEDKRRKWLGGRNDFDQDYTSEESEEESDNYESDDSWGFAPSPKYSDEEESSEKENDRLTGKKRKREAPLENRCTIC